MANKKNTDKPIHPHTPADAKGTDHTTGSVSRRQLLGQGASLLGVAALAGTLPRTGLAVETTPKKIRIGVVGGNMGASFAWNLHPDAIVTAVSDLRPERRQHLVNTYQCQNAHESLEKLVRDKNVDAVSIYTDGVLHVQHVVEAMKHGKHVFCTVPACNSLEEAQLLLDTVNKYGLTYMMGETSYFRATCITAREWFKEGRFGDLFYTEAEYQHPGLEFIFFENGKRTWRHGMPPMSYPTHSTCFVTGVTGERLTSVTCHGWGDNDPILQDNAYNNPFWNESAMFRTNLGNAFRCNVWWKGAYRGCERGQWIGTKTSLYAPHPNGLDAVVVRSGEQMIPDEGGHLVAAPPFENHKSIEWWLTDRLPEPLRQFSGYEGSLNFLVHEFVDSLVKKRRPAVDVYEALAETVPGVVAHQSALRDGETLKVPQFDPA